MADKINKTQLDVEKAEERGLVHRDYIAHCLRWNYALRFVDYQTTILDLGCGDGMLSQVLYVNKYKPKLYVGVDVRSNALDAMMKRPANFKKLACNLDIREDSIVYIPLKSLQIENTFDSFFDVVVCFEVIEHFESKYLAHVLNEIYRVLKPGGTLLLSTPNYDGVHKAANHIHEYREAELDYAFSMSKFQVEKKIGTFASQKDLLPYLNEHEQWVFERIRGFLDSNILSVVFASLHPSQSRNILWVARKT